MPLSIFDIPNHCFMQIVHESTGRIAGADKSILQTSQRMFDKVQACYLVEYQDEYVSNGQIDYLKSINGIGLLHIAIYANNIQLLNDIHKRISMDEMTKLVYPPIFYAVFHKRNKMIKRLLDLGHPLSHPNYSFSALHAAAMVGKMDIIELCYENNIDFNERTRFENSKVNKIRLGHFPRSQNDLGIPEMTPLFAAYDSFLLNKTFDEKQVRIKQLVEYGADCNKICHHHYFKSNHTLTMEIAGDIQSGTIPENDHDKAADLLSFLIKNGASIFIPDQTDREKFDKKTTIFKYQNVPELLHSRAEKDPELRDALVEQLRESATKTDFDTEDSMEWLTHKIAHMTVYDIPNEVKLGS